MISDSLSAVFNYVKIFVCPFFRIILKIYSIKCSFFTNFVFCITKKIYRRISCKEFRWLLLWLRISTTYCNWAWRNIILIGVNGSSDYNLHHNCFSSRNRQAFKYELQPVGTKRIQKSRKVYFTIGNDNYRFNVYFRSIAAVSEVYVYGNNHVCRRHCCCKNI